MVRMLDHLHGLRAALAAQYAPLRLIGTGATSFVFLARDVKHERQVALKVLRAEFAGEAWAERFLREIRTVARLQHPNILPLYDSGIALGLPYYVMPFVQGPSLRDRLNRQGRLALKDALAVTRSVGCALDYAHRQGVIHRDIKPENVLLLDGEAVVVDFGIAIATYDGLSACRDRAGTPEYMSPEQIAGQAVDPRTDIYSLCCVMYEMLVGRPPFTGPSADGILAAQLCETAEPLARFRPDVPEAVCTVLNRGLSKAPSDRSSTMREFVRALLSGTTPAERFSGGRAA